MDEHTPQLHVDESVATISLRRPEVANRLSPADLRVLKAHVDAVNDMERVLVLRFTATGKYFCSGYNIAFLTGKADEGAFNFGEVMDAIEAARPVTIAAINGGVYGGATDFCLACDFRIGVPHCDMFMSAARLGLHFYRGGMERYVSRLGINAAKRLFLSAEKIDAETMLRLGFLTEIVPAADLAARMEQLTSQLAGMAPIALLGMKKHLNAIPRSTGSCHAAKITQTSNRIHGLLTQIHPALERVLRPPLNHPAVPDLLKRYPSPLVRDRRIFPVRPFPSFFCVVS